MKVGTKELSIEINASRNQGTLNRDRCRQEPRNSQQEQMQVGTKELSIGIDAFKDIFWCISITILYSGLVRSPCLKDPWHHLVREGNIQICLQQLLETMECFASDFTGTNIYCLFVFCFIVCLFVSSKTLKRLNRPSPVFSGTREGLLPVKSLVFILKFSNKSREVW